MEEDDEEGAPSQGIGGVERRGLVDIFRQQVHPPAAAIAIGGQRENFYDQTLQRKGGAAGSSAGGVLLPLLQCLSRLGPMRA